MAALLACPGVEQIDAWSGEEEWKRLRMEECIVEALVGSDSGMCSIAVESGERRRDVSAEFAERRVVEVRRWCGR